MSQVKRVGAVKRKHDEVIDLSREDKLVIRKKSGKPMASLGRWQKVAAGPELKFFDTTLAFNIDATGEVPATGQLSLIRLGTGAQNRTGRIVTVKSIQLRMQILYTPGAATTGASSYCILLVLDKQCNEGAASATSVMTSAAFTQGLVNLNNNKRFQILRRIVSDVQSGAGIQTAFASVNKTHDVFMKCNIPLIYDADDGNVGDLTSNNLFLLASADGSDDLVSVNGTARLRFQDS